MLYLDSPAGIGFSFSANKSNLVNDEMTGHYAPQLTQLIFQTKTNINLKGIAVGGYVDSLDGLLELCSLKQQRKQNMDVFLGDDTFSFLNKKEVQKALHAKLVGVRRWSTCMALVYDWRNFEIPTVSILGTLVKSGVRVMVYSGDHDSAVPFTGTQALINGLAKDLGLGTTESYRPWFENKQVGGWSQVYGDLLSFATIRGAGHAAPAFQPGRSLALFKAFLEGKPLPKIS